MERSDGKEKGDSRVDLGCRGSGMLSQCPFSSRAEAERLGERTGRLKLRHFTHSSAVLSLKVGPDAAGRWPTC